MTEPTEEQRAAATAILNNTELAEAIRAMVRAVCDEEGWDAAEVKFHSPDMCGCYCACPEGPCQHIWDGPEYRSEDGCMFSVTCSRCGAVAAYHDLRCAP